MTKQHLEKWKPDEQGFYRIAKSELVDVLVNRLGWRAYALALEAAGDWR